MTDTPSNQPTDDQAAQAQADGERQTKQWALGWADDAIAQGNYHEVEDYVRDLLGDPEFGRTAHAKVGLSYAYRGAPEEAESHFAQSDIDQSVKAEAMRTANELRAKQLVDWADEALRAGDYETAESGLSHAALLPGATERQDLTRIHYDLAVVFANQGDAARAGEHLRAAGRDESELQSLLNQAEQGTDGEELIAQGDAALESNDFATALRKYAESLVHRGTPVGRMTAVHMRLAKAHAMAGDENKATEHLTAAGRDLSNVQELAQLTIADIDAGQ